MTEQEANALAEKLSRYKMLDGVRAGLSAKVKTLTENQVDCIVLKSSMCGLVSLSAGDMLSDCVSFIKGKLEQELAEVTKQIEDL
jgi:hypothetical protein